MREGDAILGCNGALLLGMRQPGAWNPGTGVVDFLLDPITLFSAEKHTI